MPNGKKISPKRKLEIIKEAKESGSVPEGALLSDYVNVVNEYLERNPPPDYYNPTEADIKDSDYFGETDYVSRASRMQPQEIVQSIRDENIFGGGGSQVQSFVQQLNESGYPYKAVLNQADESGYSLGFTKNIDRYEKARNYQGDLFLKYYTDGSYDVLDEATFNKEKGFNLLPPSIKARYSTMVDLSDSSI